MVIKVINSALILFAVYMGIKHGWNMLNAKPEMIEMFGKWNLNKNFVMINGAITLHSYFVSKNVCLGKFAYGSWNIINYLHATSAQRLKRRGY